MSIQQVTEEHYGNELARDVLGILLEGHSIVMLDYTNSSDPHWIAKPGGWTSEAYRGSTPFESLVALVAKFNEREQIGANDEG